MFRAIAIAFILALNAVGVSVDAAEITAVGVHTVSTHSVEKYVDRSDGLVKNYRNKNTGLYVRIEDPDMIGSINVGTYENSVYRRTTYVTYGAFAENEYGHIGGTIGLGTGYAKTFTGKSGLYLVGGIVVGAKLTDELSVNLVHVPAICSTCSSVSHITIEINIK